MKAKKPAVDKQRKNNGRASGRNNKGKFEKGNTEGFKPGQSGNPSGRPKSVTLSENYRQLLATLVPNDPEGRSFAELIAYKLVLNAALGDLASAKEIADRTEGKPRQAVDLDVTLLDWRELAETYGLSETDVIDEARQIIESALASSGAQPHRAEKTKRGARSRPTRQARRPRA